MANNSINGFIVMNWKEVDRMFKSLDVTQNKAAQVSIRKAMKKPMFTVRGRMYMNLKRIMSTSPVATGTLLRSLGVGSRFSKRVGYFSVVLGGRKRQKPQNPKKNRVSGAHFHLVNSGTAPRYTKKGLFRGAVGKGRSKGNPRTNPSFRTGFADAPISQSLNFIAGSVANDLRAIYEDIVKKNAT